MKTTTTRTLTHLLVALLVLLLAPTQTFAERQPERPEPANGKARADAISHYLTSEIYRHRGDYRTWLRQLEKAAKKDSANIRLQTRLIAAYTGFRNYNKAIRLAEKTRELDPDNISLLIWLGRLYYEKDRVDDSMAAFEQALAIDATSTAALEALAELKADTNDLVAEVELYEKLVTVAPESATIWFDLGTGLYELGAFREASESFEKAIEFDPAMGRARYLAAVVHMDMGDYETAESKLEDFLVHYPDHARARTNLAGCMARRGDYEDAIEQITEVIESAGVDPEHHIYRMYLLLRQEATPDASLAIAPSSAPILGSLMMTLVRRRAGEPHDRMLRGLDQIEGDLDAECSNYLNGLLRIFGDEDAGAFLERQFAQILDEGYRTQALETVRGRALISRDKPSEARDVLLGIVERYGGDRRTHYYLASIYDDLDERDKAAEQLRACLRLDPNDADAMNFLGYMFAEENINLEEAEALLVRALEVDPENGYYLDSLGWVYYRQGRGQEAVDFIERAIRNMSGDDAILRDHLGDAYLMTGDADRAVQEWRRARRLDPELEGVQKKIDRHSE